MSNYLLFVLPILAYLLGSISSAVLLSRMYNLPDPRTIGSKNPGTVNILRYGQIKIALCVLLFDILKGMLPVWLAYRLGFPIFYVSMTALASCIGHAYPIFFRFKGGKSVATALGAVAPIGFDLSGLMIATWLLVLIVTRYASLASIIAAVAAPIYIWWFRPEYTFAVAMLSCLIIWRHHENLERLWRHQEPKISSKSIRR